MRQVESDAGDADAADDRCPREGSEHQCGKQVGQGQSDKGDTLGAPRHRMVLLPGSNGLAEARMVA